MCLGETFNEMCLVCCKIHDESILNETFLNFKTSCATHIKFAYIHNLLECTTNIFIDIGHIFFILCFSLQWTCKQFPNDFVVTYYN